MRGCFFFLIILLYPLWGLGRSITDKQSGTENQFLNALISGFGMYQATHEGVLATNWTMLSEWFNDDFWPSWEKKFGTFGKQKGFTNSIFEKYVWVKPGVVVVTTQPPKEILLMSSVPLQEGTNLIRRAILLEGTNIVERHIPEDFVQKSFQIAGRAIPGPDPSLFPAAARTNAANEPPAAPSIEAATPLEGQIPSTLSSAKENGSSPLLPATTNEIVALAPASQPRSWWVIVAVIMGSVLFLVLRRRKSS